MNKSPNSRVFSFFLVLTLLILGGGFFYYFSSRPETSQKRTENSRLVQTSQKKSLASSRTQSIPPLTSSGETPSPQEGSPTETAQAGHCSNELTEEEKALFPDAKLLEEETLPGKNLGETLRVRHLYTDLKYPHLLVEDLYDANGNLLNHKMVAADHLLVTIQPWETPQHLLSELGSIATSLEPLDPKHQLYQLQLKQNDIHALETAEEKIAENSHILTTNQDQLYQQPREEKRENVLHLPPPGPKNVYFPRYYRLACASATSSNISRGNTSLKDDPNDSPIKTPPQGKVIVAVLDSGARRTHQDITPYLWSDPQYSGAAIHGINTVENNNNVEDHDGHGTHCAGIITSTVKRYLGEDSSKALQIMVCKFMDKDTGFESDAIKGIDYAIKNGASIINCSWGSSDNDPLLEKSIEKAKRAGVIIVAAAGNDGFNLEEHPFYPASLNEDNVISVAAFGKNNTLTPFSNFSHKLVTLAAPGENIISAYNGSDQDYVSWSGTSMAAPYVTATLALLKEISPKAPMKNLIQQIEMTTRKDFTDVVQETRFGLLDIEEAIRE